MAKISVAIIKDKDNKILLTRRAIGEKFAGVWELPGGKVKDGERASAGLKRELGEKLNIDATIGKMVNSVKLDKYEVCAYNVQNFDGDICLARYDAMVWVPFERVMSYHILPADRQIIMNIAKIKPENTDKNFNVLNYITRNIEKPVFDTAEKRWVVTFAEIESKPAKVKFTNQYDAIAFYVNKVRMLLNPFFAQPGKESQYQ